MASKIIVDQLEKTGGSLTALTLPASNASASQYLQNDGSGALSWATVASSGFIGYTVYTGGATWLKSANTPTKIIVEVQGGGGGGGGGYNGGGSGANGGAGGYVRKFIDVSSITTSTIVVGAGGAGGGHIIAGSAGGASSWSDGTNTLTGGLGNGGGPGTISAQGTGGTGGAATGGDFHVPGTNGSSNTANPKNSAGSFLGFPNPRTTLGVGSGLPGLGYGAQGSGGQGPGVYVGGAGTAGVVIVWEYK
jgi:hypothetical protein